VCARSEEKVAIAQRIRRYLGTKRTAGDSLAGIVAWWLMRERYAESAERVRQALEYLKEHEQVERREGRDGTVRYFAVARRLTTR
jgi:hypothetical protein